MAKKEPFKSARASTLRAPPTPKDKTLLHEDVPALRERARHLADIVERSPTVVFRWRIESGWGVEFVSANVTQFDYSQDDFLSGRVSWVAITHPDDVPRLEREVAAHMAADHREFRQSYRLRDGKGHYRWIEDSNRLIFNENGDLTHVEGLVVDVSERKAVEAIAEAAIEHSPVATIVTDDDNRIVRFNQATQELTGYAHTELPDIATWIRKLYPAPADRNQVLHDAENLRLGNPLQHPYYRVTRKKGDQRLIRFHVSKFLGGMVVQMQDVTEHVRLEQAIVDAVDGERTQWGQALHDILGQDLVALSFQVGALAQDVGDGRLPALADVEQIREQVRRSIGRARSLAQGLNILGLMNENLATALLKLANRSETLYGLKVVSHISEAIPQLDNSVANHLYFIVQEALSNVARHARATSVWVGCEWNGGELTVSVADNGQGIETDVDNDGMGLAIMRHRMDLVGGRLSIDPRPGGGTRVVCQLSC